MNNEVLEKLNKLEEDSGSSEFSLPLIFENGRLITAPTWELVIPEGETKSYRLDWRLFASINGWYFTTLKSITFPSTLKHLDYVFTTQPQYNITFIFNCNVMDLIDDLCERNENFEWHRENILAAKTEEKKEERIKRTLCYAINIPYTRAEFVFNVSLDTHAFDPVDL